MHWDIGTLIPVFGTITYGVIFLVVTFSKPQSQAHQAFKWYLLAMVIWSLSALLVFVDVGRVQFWFRMMIFAALGSMIAIFYFVQTILLQKRIWAGWVFWYGAISMLASLFTDLVAHDIAVQGGVLSYEFSPFVGLFAGPGYGLTIFSFVELLRGYRQSENAHQRNQLRYLLIGLGLIIVASMVNFTPLGIYPIDIAANGVTAVLIAYAILRHSLLDIKVAFRKGLLYSIPTIIIGAAYFLIITLALNIFHFYVLVAGSAIEIFLISFTVAILTAMLAEPLRGNAQSWIDRLFFREKYDSTLMLQRLSSNAASVLDLLEITSMILDEVTSTLHIKRAAFFLKHENSGEFGLTSQRGFVDDQTITLRNGHPLIQWFSTHDTVLMSNALQVLPQFKALWGLERQDLDRIGAEFFIPLKSKNELVGIFAVGPKQSEAPYSQDDQLTLTTLANQTAVAIENARLFNNEAIRRQEAETWSNVLSKLTSALDIEHVLESTLMHIREVIPFDRAQVYLLADRNNIRYVDRIWTASGEDPMVVNSEESGLFYNPSRHGEQHLNNGNIEHDDVSNINLRLPAKIKHLIEFGVPLIIPDKTSRPAWFTENYPTGSWMGAPIIVQGNVAACISLDKLNSDFYQKNHLDTLNIFAGQTALALQNASLFHEVQQLAITDDLTGILNRRNLFAMGESALNLAQRSDSNLSLIMLDLDNLKQINDNFGHIVGDQALRFVANHYKNSLRDIDIFGRYGGDEFVIILPQTNLSNATLLAERLCLLLKEDPLIVDDDLVPVTASFGVAKYDHDTHDLAALIHQADLAMYNAKHSGRDQIFVKPPDLAAHSIETVDS